MMSLPAVGTCSNNKQQPLQCVSRSNQNVADYNMTFKEAW